MRRLGFLLAVSLAGATFGGVAARPQDFGSGFSGADDFKTFCASCHGLGAKGDGALASSFKKRPPDLTLLAKGNEGTFPFEQVFKTVDGRTPVKGHGGKDMPVWGDTFAQSRGSQTPEAVKARIESIVRYLERIQQKD